MIFPSRSATSRHKSFSIKPVGPIVPVSCPPCPGSITRRPIFRPRVRVKVDCPSRVGCGALAGRTKSGFASAADALYDLDFGFFALGIVLRGFGIGLVAPAELSSMQVTTVFELAGVVESVGGAASALEFFAESVCVY